MKVNDFIDYLDHSDRIATLSEDEIMPIIEEFPYCQTGHMMYTIQLNTNSSILFEEQLKKTASICPDRRKLFEHLHQDTVEKLPPEEKISPSKEIDVSIEEEKEDEKFIPTAGSDELALLEKEYLSQAISSSILLESDKIAEADDLERVPEEVQEIDLFDDKEAHSFSDWLKHYSGEEVVGEDTSPVEKKRTKQDIIDKFIQEDPRIEPKKTAFYSPTNMARLSVVDSGIVSETLALIHVDQGNFQEAISTYEKLMMKNPKKSSYFAAQIKILKQKLKQ